VFLQQQKNKTYGLFFAPPRNLIKALYYWKIIFENTVLSLNGYCAIIL